MDFLTFILNIIEALAWPAVVMLVVWKVRLKPSDIPRFIKSLKVGGAEIEFREHLEEVRESAEELTIPAASPEAEKVIPVEAEYELAQLSPAGAILRAWQGVEAELHALARRKGIEDQPRKIFRLIDALGQRQILAPEILELLHGMRRLRNDAVHIPGEEITPGMAVEFQILTENVIRHIQSVPVG